MFLYVLNSLKKKKVYYQKVELLFSPKLCQIDLFLPYKFEISNLHPFTGFASEIF